MMQLKFLTLYCVRWTPALYNNMQQHDISEMLRRHYGETKGRQSAAIPASLYAWFAFSCKFRLLFFCSMAGRWRSQWEAWGQDKLKCFFYWWILPRGQREIISPSPETKGNWCHCLPCMLKREKAEQLKERAIDVCLTQRRIDVTLWAAN